MIEACERRHRSVEFRALLDRIEAAVLPNPEIHLVLDTLKTHRTRLVHDWLLGRPRFHLHLTLISASWLTWWSTGSPS